MENIDVSNLDVGDIFSFHEGEKLYQLIDVKSLGKNKDNVWAYSNEEIGDFEGLVCDGNNSDCYTEEVLYYGETL